MTYHSNCVAMFKLYAHPLVKGYPHWISIGLFHRFAFWIYVICLVFSISLGAVAMFKRNTLQHTHGLLMIWDHYYYDFLVAILSIFCFYKMSGVDIEGNWRFFFVVDIPGCQQNQEIVCKFCWNSLFLCRLFLLFFCLFRHVTIVID